MYCSKKKMSSCIMNNQESDEEVDLEALRLAALKSRKTKYGPRVNHNNLIPIVPVPIEDSESLKTKIKKEKVSPTPERTLTDEVKLECPKQENEEDKGSNYSESSFGNDQDILSVDDKEEEDSLERLMDQLEAEISGKVPIPSNRIVVSSKSSSEKKDKRKKLKKTKKDGDDEVELVQIKSGREPGAIIEIRESASPVYLPKDEAANNSGLPPQAKSPPWRSRSKLRSRSPCYRSRSYRRSRSPYWLKRSRSPFRRSRSPFWRARRSRSSSRKSRSPLRRYRSPVRKRSPFSRFSRSRSRSRSIDRRSPWSLSPRRRSKSPYYRDGVPTPRRKNFDSPSGRLRRSFSPREGSNSPRRRSRSPRRSFRNSPFRSKSPFGRSRSLFRRTPRRSQSPFLRHSKSPNNVSKSPYSRRSPGGRSKTPNRWSASPGRRQKFSEQASPKPISKSPSKKNETNRRSPNRTVPKDERSLGTSPTNRRNRSPLRVVEKNKLDANDKMERPNDRIRNEKRRRSLSRENNKNSNRRPYRQKPFKRFSPLKSRTSAERQTKRSKSPKQKDADKNKEETLNQNVKDDETNPNPTEPLDPILEARKKKFENLKEIDPTKDKKISLKAIKESTENFEDDEDALTINIESNLWDESEESGDEFESRFKSSDARKNRTVIPGRTVLSFRNLREKDSASQKVILNKPLIEDNRIDKFKRGERQDRWKGKKNDRTEIRKRSYDEGLKNRSEEVSKSKPRINDERRSDRKPIVWSNKNTSKSEVGRKTAEETAVQNEAKESRNSKKLKDCRDRLGKEEGVMTEADDFDKLISDFEKELESDISPSFKEVSSTVLVNQNEMKRPNISVKKDLFEPKLSVPEVAVKKPASVRRVKISEANSKRIDSSIDLEETDTLIPEPNVNLDVLQQDGPEDYIEDDDFVLDVAERRKAKNKLEDDDVQSDLRAILSRRRNERLTKTVSLQENMPTRLVQSAFQGLGNTKAKRQVREVQEPVEMIFERNIKNTGGEGRRVLLLHRERNTSSSSDKNTVPEVKPDSTIYQRLSRSSEKRKRKLQRQMDSMDNLDQEEEEEGLEGEEEKQSRRFRLKRNVKLSSQVSLEPEPFPRPSYVQYEVYKFSVNTNTNSYVNTN